MDAEYVYIPPPPPPAPVVVEPEPVTNSTDTNSTAPADSSATATAETTDVKTDGSEAGKNATTDVAAARLINNPYFMPGNVLNKDFVLKSAITLVTSSIAVGLSVIALQ